MIGRTLSHYTITAKLGEGGMGEVWRATDASLNRDVAVKVLPSDMAADPERLERFTREAQAIAALNHPNIVTIYSVEEADGVHLLTMELIEGKSLADGLPPSGFEPDKLFPLAIQIADALAAAHDKEIVHRDLKPANVMLTGQGRVKILDFGLAKLAEGEPDDDEATQLKTQAGMILGTVPYMSPEQVQGQPVDHRSDIFSLGILLYEMATGRRPFRGENSASVISAVLKDHPPPVTELKTALPNHFGRIVRRCLEKSPDRRFQSAREIQLELEALWDESRPAVSAVAPAASPSPAPGPSDPRRRFTRAAAGLGAIAVLALGGLWLAQREGAEPGPSAEARDLRSVAVLPFENLSGETDGESFAAGIHDDVLTQLAKISDLKTISRTSVLEYEDSDKSISEIGRELGVAAVVEGGVRRAGEMVRINVKLIEAETEQNLWAESYDRELTTSNIFAIQGEIAAAIASALDATLSPEEEQRLGSVPTANLEAYDLYLRGLEAHNRPGRLQRDLYEAEQWLLDAIELDPSFAVAYAELSAVYIDLYWLAGEQTRERLEQGFEAARKAIELAPERGEGHLSLGACYYVERDFARARHEFEIAEKTLPQDPELVLSWAALTRREGRFEESIPQWERAIELNPRDAFTWWDLGNTYQYLQRYDEANRFFNRALEITPALTEAKMWRAISRTSQRASREASRRELEALDPEALRRTKLTAFAWRIGLTGRETGDLFALLAGEDEMVSYQYFEYPKDLLLAITHGLAGDERRAQEAYRSAAARLEPGVEARPDYALTRAALGLAYAGLGRKEEAVREGLRAVELLPIERDALVGSWLQSDLGFIYAEVGDHEAAVAAFERYLSHPHLFSAGMLALDPRLEALLEHPGFQRLLDRYGPEVSS